MNNRDIKLSKITKELIIEELIAGNKKQKEYYNQLGGQLPECRNPRLRGAHDSNKRELEFLTKYQSETKNS